MKQNFFGCALLFQLVNSELFTKYHIYKNKTVPSEFNSIFQLINFSTRDAIDCGAQCNLHIECVMFSFDTSIKSCQLYNKNSSFFDILIFSENTTVYTSPKANPCQSDYFHDKNLVGGKFNKCSLKKNFSEACDEIIKCLDVLGLTCINSSCTCLNNTVNYWLATSSVCAPRKLYDFQCTSHFECREDLGLECFTESCKCVDSTKYWSASLNSCVAKKLNGVSCEISGECREDLGLGCSAFNCICLDETKYWSITSSQCVLKKRFGDKCDSNVECSSCHGLVCSMLSYTCVCDIGDYYANIAKCVVYKGCMVDNDQRVLKNMFKYDFASPELCAKKCNSLSMKYMGLEARDECFCDPSNYDTLGIGTGCDQNCDNDNTKICGGDWRLSVYELIGLTCA